MAASAKKDIVTIGGSAGSGTVLRRLLGQLPRDLPASVFVSTHIPTRAAGLLHQNLASSATLPVSQAMDGQPIERGHV
jgi:two-component system chemotaxis response regulator CheB